MYNNLSSVHTAAEIADMLLTIDDIQMILRTAPFDEDTARQKVYETNAKHPDNKMIWNLLHANVASVDKGIHNKTTKYGLPTY